MLQGRQNSLGGVLSIHFSCFVDMNKTSERGHRKLKQPLFTRCLHQFNTKSAYSDISPPLLGNHKSPGAVFSQCVAMKRPRVGFN